MRYSDKLQTAIQEQNIVHARTAILSYLNRDETNPTPQALRIAIEVADKFTNPEDPFWDPENHLWEIPPQHEWDVHFLIKIKAALLTNFSKEKLELAEQVISYLREQGLRDFQAKRTPEKDLSLEQASRGEKKNIISPQPAYHPGGKYQTTPRRRAPSRDPQTEFLAGAIVGGVALGGAGLMIGLIAGCALKATVSGIVIGGVAGGLLNQSKKHR